MTEPVNTASDSIATATSPALDDRVESARKTSLLVYILQASGFFFGITFIAAVIVNYIKKDEVQGTWLESHFRWQMRTFWFSAMWTVLAAILFIVVIGYFILLANVVWTLYRVIKGLIRLNGQQEMYTN
ncbi:hypothetical protein [Thioalkalivibrio sp. ALJ16]|uniref:DUF4870 family protein n=1 Tax=Thioalkalivibrio sp. ALJ16 TaxID=1158762 RepID=UPI0003685C4D|nr:hypothetical protein [Thioalkalivibrio sp. ALJ16]